MFFLYEKSNQIKLFSGIPLPNIEINSAIYFIVIK